MKVLNIKIIAIHQKEENPGKRHRPYLYQDHRRKLFKQRDISYRYKKHIGPQLDKTRKETPYRHT